MDATHTLDRFHDDRGCFVVMIRKPGFQRSFIIKRQEYDIVRFIDRRYEGLVIRGRNNQGCPAVKGFREGYDFLSTRMKGGKLHRILIGLGPRVAEEQMI